MDVLECAELPIADNSAQGGTPLKIAVDGQRRSDYVDHEVRQLLAVIERMDGQLAQVIDEDDTGYQIAK